MTKPNSTEIVFVVDRSGSMCAIAPDMRGGFDTFIQKQKEVAGECRVTLAQFDDQYEVVYAAQPLDKVKPLELIPRGSTALLDAIGRTIDATGLRLAQMKEEDRPSQVLFVIITDGQENCSREYNQQRVFDMITRQRETYSWEFVFLGANQDSIATATSIGISSYNSVTYDATSVGSKALMNGLAQNVAVYRTAGVARSAKLYDQESYEAVKNVTETE